MRGLLAVVEKWGLGWSGPFRAWPILPSDAQGSERGKADLIVLETETALATFRADTASGTVITLPVQSSDAPDVSSWRPTVVPGRMMGRFRLIERLGQGSQGEVWRAIESGLGGSEVALKLMPPILASDPRRLAQFRHEAERGKRLSGPALLPTLEHGVSDGTPFMAMPLVDGCSLVEVLARRRDPAEASGSPARLHRLALATEAQYLLGVARVVARVARGLATAHAADVVHRDIKPANILLDRRREGEGFLCDFGLGRDLDIATPAQLRDGAGTPLYMAPERLLRRRADEVLSDIYALGATLFEALTLTPPISVPEGLAWHDWASHLATARTVPPSTRRPGVPAELDAIVMKAIARRPDHRYRTADLLADDLDRFLAGGL